MRVSAVILLCCCVCSDTDMGVLERGMGVAGQDFQAMPPGIAWCDKSGEQADVSKCCGPEATAQSPAMPGEKHNARQEARQ